MIIYDTLCEYREGLVCEDLKTLCETWKKLNGKKYCLIYQPINPSDDFGEICDLVYKCGDVSFVVEEIDTFLTLNTSGIDRRFLNIVQRGRHRQVELIGITQRPYAIPAILRSQCKELYTFRQFETRDLDWLKGIIGESALQVKDLQRYEYIAFENGNIDKRKTKTLSKTLPELSVQQGQGESILSKRDKQEDQEVDL